MKTGLRLLCVAFLVISLRAGEPTNPAGVILYAETPDGIELLLADHAAPSDRGWASFGGTHQPGETIAETAARETEEETHGYFDRRDILRVIENEKPIFDGPYAFYFLKIDKVPVDRIVAHPVPAASDYHERGPYAWIPLSEIEKFFDPDTVTFPLKISPEYLPAGRHTDWIWPFWLHNLAQAEGQGLLPWEKEKTAR